ncbi:MAG: hypothetical protein OIF50_10765, partial [Flavobacteriaceae bacterium]|nr:hypothetical protein [Flavobacteriaceae bacterium]
IYSISFELREKEKLVRLGKVRAIGPMQSINYRFLTRHSLIDFPSEELDVYLEEFKSKNQDTLHIGTIAQFKKKHPGFLERLTKNDSISVTLLNNEDMPGKVIKVPVRY